MELNRSTFYYISQLPVRAQRLFKHCLFPLYKRNPNDFPPTSILEWIFDLWFYIIDMVGLPEIYQILMRFFKWNLRSLTDEESALAKSIFGDNIRLELIKIDDAARFGTRKVAAAYVSFNTINYFQKIRKEVFIHELVHIWQFQHFGSIYIARAIKAQRSKAGYDYGGLPNLYHQMMKGAKLTDFNFEQQADIIEDFYRITTQSVRSAPMHLSIYQYFAAQLAINNVSSS